MFREGRQLLAIWDFLRMTLYWLNNFYPDVSICSPNFDVYENYYTVRILKKSCSLAVTFWLVISRVSLQVVWGYDSRREDQDILAEFS